MVLWFNTPCWQGRYGKRQLDQEEGQTNLYPGTGREESVLEIRETEESHKPPLALFIKTPSPKSSYTSLKCTTNQGPLVQIHKPGTDMSPSDHHPDNR